MFPLFIRMIKKTLVDLLNLPVILFDTCVDSWSSSPAETVLSENISLRWKNGGRLKGLRRDRRYTTESPVAIGTRPTRAHYLHLSLSPASHLQARIPFSIVLPFNTRASTRRMRPTHAIIPGLYAHMGFQNISSNNQ